MALVGVLILTAKTDLHKKENFVRSLLRKNQMLYEFKNGEKHGFFFQDKTKKFLRELQDKPEASMKNLLSEKSFILVCNQKIILGELQKAEENEVFGSISEDLRMRFQSISKTDFVSVDQILQQQQNEEFQVFLLAVTENSDENSENIFQCKMIVLQQKIVEFGDHKFLMVEIFDCSWPVNLLVNAVSEEFNFKLIQTLSHEQMTPLNSVENYSSQLIQEQVQSMKFENIVLGTIENVFVPENETHKITMSFETPENQTLKSLIAIWAAGKTLKLHSQSQSIVLQSKQNDFENNFTRLSKVKCLNELHSVKLGETTLSNNLVKLLHLFERQIASKKLEISIIETKEVRNLFKNLN